MPSEYVKNPNYAYDLPLDEWCLIAWQTQVIWGVNWILRGVFFKKSAHGNTWAMH